MLVTAYFVVTKLFDFAWKAQLRLFYPSTVEFQVGEGLGLKAGVERKVWRERWDATGGLRYGKKDRLHTSRLHKPASVPGLSPHCDRDLPVSGSPKG